jgi:hypothetical protein
MMRLNAEECHRNHRDGLLSEDAAILSLLNEEGMEVLK